MASVFILEARNGVDSGGFTKLRENDLGERFSGKQTFLKHSRWKIEVFLFWIFNNRLVISQTTLYPLLGLI
jgi:hypothetical protein